MPKNVTKEAPPVPPSKDKDSSAQYKELIAMYNTLAAKHNICIEALKLSNKDVQRLEGEVKSLTLLIEG